LNYEKIELLINIIYDILFYDDIEDLKLKKDIDDKFQEIIENNNLNFSLSKQIKNASQVYLYKDHYKTNILTKFKRYYYKLSDIALVDPLT